MRTRRPKKTPDPFLNGVQVGIDDAGDDADSFRDDLVLYVGDGNTPSMTTLLADFTAGTTYLILVTITNDTSGMDTISAAVYADGLTNLATPTGTTGDVLGEISDDLERLAFTRDGPDDDLSGTAVFDEFRLGTELSDVVVPEPSTLAALGLLGLIGFGRRRKR